MQDPAVLERLQAMSKNETFQERVAQMTQDPKFMAAATEGTLRRPPRGARWSSRARPVIAP